MEKAESGYNINNVEIPSSAWKVLAVLASLATMVMYAETMLIPAIPDLIRDFDVSYSMSSWILTAYLISGAVMTPIAGKLADTYGKKKILLGILAVYIIGLAMAGFSTNIYFLVAARAIQGVGMAMFVIAFGIIRDQFPREKLSIGQGVISSMFASGAVLGLLLGGIIIQNYGWEATFLSAIPIAIALFIINSKFNYEKQALEIRRGENPDRMTRDTPMTVEGHPKKGTVDIKGAITLAAFVTLFLLVLTLSETSGNDAGSSGLPVLVYTLIALGIASFALFVFIERREKYPLVDFKLILHKAILPSNLIILVVGFSMFMVFQTIPVLVRNPQPFGFGGDAAEAGYVQLPFAIVLLIFGPTSGFIVAKMGSIRPIIIGIAVTTSGFLGLLAFHTDFFAISINLAILSTGLSLTNVGALNVTMLATPIQHMGMSLGTTGLLRIIGSSIGPALAGMYMQANQSTMVIAGQIVSFPTANAYDSIFLTAVILSAASFGLALFLRGKVKKMSIPNLS
ncbi:MAG: MFS transporter [Thermoproteota archaeon]|nr:MFS transporter [Thermoproteota archaeon]